MILRPRDVAAVVGLLIIGSLAFVHLSAIPVFEDEGTQLRWIHRIIQAGEWLAPLGEGKPLEAWPMVPLVRWGFQPLTTARALHVMAGMIGAVLIYALGLQLADRWTATVSGALFTVCPFVIYLQRFALSDMFLCTAGICALVSAIRLMREPTWTNTIAPALALTLAALCKLPLGFIFLTSIPLALVMMPQAERARLLSRDAVGKLAGAHAPAALLLLAILVAASFRVRRGQAAGFGIQDLAGISLGGYANIGTVMGIARPELFGELAAQLSGPVTVIGLLGLVAGALCNDWRHRWLIVSGLVPMLAIGFMAHFWFSRYLLFTLPPLIVAAVSGWRRVLSHAHRFRLPFEAALLITCFGLMGRQSARLILDPRSADWSAVDRFQYFEGWGSGYGYSEAARFVIDAPRGPTMIFSLDGHSAYQLATYLPTQWTDRVTSIAYGADGRVRTGGTARFENLAGPPRVWIIAASELLQSELRSNFDPSQIRRLGLRQLAVFDKPTITCRGTMRGGSSPSHRLALYEVNPS